MNDIKNVLEELYVIEPSLREEESRLVIILEKILADKPDTRFDRAFAEKLKEEIFSEPLRIKETEEKNSWFKWSKTVFAVAGSAIVVVFAVVAVVNRYGDINVPNQAIVQVNKNAFGPLAVAQGSGVLGQGGEKSTVAPTQLSVTSDRAVGMGGGGTGSAQPMIVAPFYGYKFVYKGDTLTLTDKEVQVLRRIKPETGRTDLVGALNSVNYGGMNLGSFRGALVGFDIVDESAEGYMINVNIKEGVISINQNWLKWYNQNEQRPPLSASDVPSDERVIEISNKFLRDHNVDMSSYGTPVVENSWRLALPVSREVKVMSEPAYVPDMLSVTYPLKVNNEEAVDTSGNKTGLRVTVEIRKNKVSNVWPIQDNRFEASLYAAETDAARIINVAENMSGTWYDSKNTKEIQLGTPTKVLLQQYVYNDKSGISAELYVPAMAFPVINAPVDYYGQKVITVPLAKDLLDTPMYGPIRPMKTLDLPEVLPASATKVEEAKLLKINQ